MILKLRIDHGVHDRVQGDPNHMVVLMSRYRAWLAGCGTVSRMGSFRATFLFAMPTWQEGAGRLVDVADALTEYNRTEPPASPDARAIAQDWLAVGDCLREAMYSDRLPA